MTFAELDSPAPSCTLLSPGSSEPIVIPSIVAARWQEALAAASMLRWRSLAQMLSSMVVNSSVYTPGSPVVDDLRTLAHVAHIHQLALQPIRESHS